MKKFIAIAAIVFSATSFADSDIEKSVRVNASFDNPASCVITGATDVYESDMGFLDREVNNPAMIYISANTNDVEYEIDGVSKTPNLPVKWFAGSEGNAKHLPIGEDRDVVMNNGKGVIEIFPVVQLKMSEAPAGNLHTTATLTIECDD